MCERKVTLLVLKWNTSTCLCQVESCNDWVPLLTTNISQRLVPTRLNPFQAITKQAQLNSTNLDYFHAHRNTYPPPYFVQSGLQSMKFLFQTSLFLPFPAISAPQRTREVSPHLGPLLLTFHKQPPKISLRIPIGVHFIAQRFQIRNPIPYSCYFWIFAFDQV